MSAMNVQLLIALKMSYTKKVKYYRLLKLPELTELNVPASELTPS